MRPEYRQKIDLKYKKKIEQIVRYNHHLLYADFSLTANKTLFLGLYRSSYPPSPPIPPRPQKSLAIQAYGTSNVI
jgi:hypothetical protein